MTSLCAFAIIRRCRRHYVFVIRLCVCVCAKVTSRPDLTGTVPNFDGLSRENYEVSPDAELSGIPKLVLILSHFECNVTSHVDKVYTYRPTILYRIRCQMRSFDSKMHQIHFRPGLCPGPRWGSFRCSPISLVGSPYPFPLHLRCLDLEQCADFLT